MTLPDSRKRERSIPQGRIRDRFDGVSDVVVHIEPGPPKTEPSDKIVEQVRVVAAQQGMEVHGINVHEIEGRYYLDLHTEMSARLPLERAHELASKLEKSIMQEIPVVEGVTSHMEPGRRPARET